MFKNERRARQAAWEAEYIRVEKFLDLAESITNDVEAAKQQIEADPYGAMSEIIGRHEQEAYYGLIVEQFQALPTEERVEALLTVFPDKTLQAALAAERERIIENQGITDKVQQAIEQGQATRRLDLRTLPLHTIVQLGLYEFDEYSAVDTQQDLLADNDHSRTIRGSIVEGGSMHILEDTFHTSYEDVIPDIRTHTVRALGHTATGDGDIEPVLYYGAPVEILKKKTTTELAAVHQNGEVIDLVLGSIVINGQEVFDFD